LKGSAAIIQHTGHFLVTFSRKLFFDVATLMHINMIQFKETTLKSRTNDLNLFNKFILRVKKALMEKHP